MVLIKPTAAWVLLVECHPHEQLCLRFGQSIWRRFWRAGQGYLQRFARALHTKWDLENEKKWSCRLMSLSYNLNQQFYLVCHVRSHNMILGLQDWPSNSWEREGLKHLPPRSVLFCFVSGCQCPLGTRKARCSFRCGRQVLQATGLKVSDRGMLYAFFYPLFYHAEFGQPCSQCEKCHLRLYSILQKHNEAAMCDYKQICMAVGKLVTSLSARMSELLEAGFRLQTSTDCLDGLATYPNRSEKESGMISYV